MIKFRVVDETLIVRLRSPRAVKNPVVECSFRFGDTHTLDAQLLAEHFRNELCILVRRLRVSAYDEGYSDGRAHRKRVEDFSGRLDGS